MSNKLVRVLSGKRVKVQVADEELREKLLSLMMDFGYISSSDEESWDFLITDSYELYKESKNSVIFVKPMTFDRGTFKLIFSNIENLVTYKGLFFLFPPQFTEGDVNKFLLVGFFLVVSVFYITHIFIPPDDLLRHLTAYKIDYDYSKIFIDTDLPKWDFHFTYDVLAGEVHRIFQFFPNDVLRDMGPVVFLQAFFFLLLFFAVREHLKRFEIKYFLLVFSVIFFQVGGRFLLARPTTFATILFLLSLGYLFNKKEKLAVATAVGLSVLYYLFFIYLIPLLFFSRKMLIPFLTGLAFWSIFAYLKGGNYFLDVFNYVLTLGKSQLHATENASLFSGIAKPAFVLFLAVAFLNWREAKKGYLYSSFFFYLSNQIRYLEVIYPLTVLSVAEKIKEFGVKVFKGNALVILIVSIAVVIGSIPSNQESLVNKEVCSEIKGKKVETNLGGNFRLMYKCENVKINPAMEVRWTKSIGLQLALGDGKLDCSDERMLNHLKKYDYLYEKSLKGKYKCLELKVVDGEWRLWKILK